MLPVQDDNEMIDSAKILLQGLYFYSTLHNDKIKPGHQICNKKCGQHS